MMNVDPLISYGPLRARVARFATLVRETISDSVRAFLARDASAAAELLDRVDFEREVTEEYEAALAESAAAPPDDVLRALKLLVRLSRLGSLACAICRRTVELGTADDAAARQALDRLAANVPALLSDALRHPEPDADRKSRPISSTDVFVDAWHAQSLSELSFLLSQDPRSFDRVRSLRAVGRALEQIDDEAREIAGQVAPYLAG